MHPNLHGLSEGAFSLPLSFSLCVVPSECHYEIISNAFSVTLDLSDICHNTQSMTTRARRIVATAVMQELVWAGAHNVQVFESWLDFT